MSRIERQLAALSESTRTDLRHLSVIWRRSPTNLLRRCMEVSERVSLPVEDVIRATAVKANADLAAKVHMEANLENAARDRKAAEARHG